MVAAISSSAGAAAAINPTAGLEARLQRYQKELSDCVNCDSANTAEGKETIQTISNKISGVRARIEAIAATQSDRPAPEPVAAPKPDNTGLGMVVDVFA